MPGFPMVAGISGLLGTSLGRTVAGPTGCSWSSWRRSWARASAGGADRVHRRQEGGGAEPPRARVIRAEHLAGGGAEVQLQVRPLAGGVEGEPEDREVGVALGEPIPPLDPRLAGVAGLVDTHARVGRDAVLV